MPLPSRALRNTRRTRWPLARSSQSTDLARRREARASRTCCRPAPAARAAAPISSSTRSTSALCSSHSGLDASTTCSSRSASAASCKVAWKASTSLCGRSRMKPTVSDKDTEPRSVRQPKCARGRVERGEQLVGRQGTRLDQRIEQRRLAGVGVADERDAEGAATLARLALRAALALDLFEPLLHRLDALADHAAVEFDLRFARATAQADAAALALQVRPAPHQARRQVLQARQFDLQLALVALRARGEDVQNDAGAVATPTRPDGAPGCAAARDSGPDRRSRPVPRWPAPWP